jgi:hypothetical protein
MIPSVRAMMESTCSSYYHGALAFTPSAEIVSYNGRQPMANAVAGQ